MTPRRLDWRAVEPKLRKIEQLLRRLADLGDFDAARLRSDDVAALAAERILTLVVDLAFAVNSHVSVAQLGRAPDAYRESFALAAEAGMISDDLAAALAPSAGTRNVLVHGYLDVDHALVAAAIVLALRDYREYTRQVAGWLKHHAAEPDGADSGGERGSPRPAGGRSIADA